MGDEACPDRIHRNLACRGDQAGLVHRDRGEAALEKVAAPPATGVQDVGVAPVSLPVSAWFWPSLCVGAARPRSTWVRRW